MSCNIEKVYVERPFRFPVDDPIHVSNLSSGEFFGKVLDINNSGLCVVSQDTIDPDTVYNFRLSVNNKGNLTEFIDVRANARWSKISEKTGTYRSGFSIHMLNAKSKIRMIRLLSLFEREAEV